MLILTTSENGPPTSSLRLWLGSVHSQLVELRDRIQI